MTNWKTARTKVRAVFAFLGSALLLVVVGVLKDLWLRGSASDWESVEIGPYNAPLKTVTVHWDAAR